MLLRQIIVYYDEFDYSLEITLLLKFHNHYLKDKKDVNQVLLIDR